MAARPASSWPSAAARSPTAGGPAPSGAFGRPPHPRVGGAPELAAQQRLAGVRLLARRPVLARAGQAADEQLVRRLVVRVERERLRRERGAGQRGAGRELAQRGVAQDRLADAGQPPPLDEQPRVEQRPGPGLDALEQLAAGERRVRRPARELHRVDGGPGAEREREGVAAQRARLAERAAQLREGPAQGPERIVGLAEHEPGQPGAGDRALGEGHVGEHRPRLVPARG